MLDVQNILSTAREQAGLTSLGDDRILEGLEVLVSSLNTEAALTESGMQRIGKTLVDTLVNRLKVEDWLARHPELLERPVEKPLFVFGLPRTGTTLTINLLASDPMRRCFLRWEAFDSVPPPRLEELHAGPRFDKAQALIDMSLKYAPHISAIHHEDGDSPTECQFAMTPSFCSQVYDSQWHVPSYHEWFMSTSYRPAMEYHKRLLQLLQAETGGRWTLKNPWHPLYLNDLTAVYPDAQLVMTHRDPVDVVGSACSLLKHVRVMFSEKVSMEAIAQTLLDTFDTMIQRTIAYKEAHGWDSIYDLQYDAQMRDPIGELKKVYAHFDEPFTPEAEAAMTAFLAGNPKGKFGKHEYSLEEFGLTRAGVRAHFRDYCERFEIPCKD